MQLAQLELTNFCQHESLTVDFPAGSITGIVGPNGSGKSTIAHALQFALLGTSGTEGTKMDDVNWRSTDGTGTVGLSFVADGTEGKLKRAVNVARASLKFGDINVRSVSSVNENLLRLLSVPVQTIEDIVFVRQGFIERVLFDRPSDRKKNMQALFGIDGTERIRELLRNEVGSLNISPIDERLAQLKHRIEQEIDPQLRSTDSDRKALQKELESQDENKLRVVVSTYEASSTLQSHVDQMSAELHHLNAQPPIDAASLQTTLDEMRKEVEQSTKTVEEARRILASFDSAKQVGQTRDALTAELTTLMQTLSAPEPKAPTLGSDMVQQGEQQLAEARAEIAAKQAFVEAFEGKGDAVCPTCHQSVQNAGALAESMKQQVAERKRLIASVDAAVKQAREAVATFERERDRHAYAVAQATSRKAVVESTLQSMPAAAAYDEQAAATMQSAIETFDCKVAELSRMEKHYNEVAQKKAARDAQIGSLMSSIDAAKRKLAQQVSPEDYTRAKTALDFVSSTREKIAELEGRFKQLQEQRAGSIKELQALEEQAKLLEGRKTYQSLCERTRAVLHYDSLPRLAMQRYLSAMNSKLNEFLSIFEVPFTCAIKDDLSVICNVPDIGEKPAGRLSGGEKVMLGVAYRVAVYSMFASSLGFMVLDEPTVMLDNDHIACVANMFELVGRYVRNSNMQLVVITHEPELVRTFDHTIQL
jgi:exonuclease SbcC